jgi:hypothetical protein
VATGSNPFCIGTPCIKSGIGSPAASSEAVGSLYMETDTAATWQQVVPSATVPAVVQAVSFFSGSGAFSATPAAGDLLLGLCAGINGGIPGNGTGWTDSGITNNTSAAPGMRVVYKTAISGESTSQTPCTGSNIMSSMMEVSGVPNFVGSLETVFFSLASPLSYVTTNANDLAVAFFARNGSQCLTPTGFSQGLSCNANGTGSTATAAQQFTGSGSSASVTYPTGFYKGMMLVLKPAAPGWRKLSTLASIYQSGSSIDSNPLILDFSTGLSATSDLLGHITVTGNTGTVTTTGSPASGNLAKFSGSTSVTSGDLSGDCTTSGALAITCTKTSGTNFGTLATANAATPPAIGGTTPASGKFTTLTATSTLTTNITGGGVQCAQVDNAGALSGTGSACGTGGGGGGTVTSVTCGPTTITGSGSCSGLLVGVQRITTTGSGTFTPDTGTNFVIIELQAGGGGGSGVASPGGTNIYVGSGGSGGGWLRVKLTSNFSGASYSVGAKGLGGAAGNNNGANGGNTTFTTTAGSPVTYTAGGGQGGGRNGPFAAPFVSGIPIGGTATGGDDNRIGGAPGVPIAVSTNNNVGSNGGSSMYSAGAPSTPLGGTNTSSAGSNADGKGGGGSGAVATGTGAAVAGGNGSDGMILIWEYS